MTDYEQVNRQMAWEQTAHGHTKRLLRVCRADLADAKSEIERLRLEARENEIQATRLGDGL